MANRLLVVVYCYYDDDSIIRIISARTPTKKSDKAMKPEYDFSNAKKASQIPHLNRLREQQARLLDVDVENWLSMQDDTTKHHISQMIRQVMAIRQITIS